MALIFGIKDTFAIEVGDIADVPTEYGIFIQFRFWIGGIPIGDWDDIIPIDPSIQYAEELCTTEVYRRERLFHAASAANVFNKVYYGYFKYDYTINPIIVPDLKDRFHLDDIGLVSIYDKYGIVLVGCTNETERIIVKDLRSDIFLVDIQLPFGFVESALKDYVAWGRSLERPKST